MQRSPLEQFERVLRVPGRMLTQSTITSRGCGVLRWSRVDRPTEEQGLPGGWLYVVEVRDRALIDMIGQAIGQDGEKRYAIVKTRAYTVRVRNRVGLIPYSYSVTSQRIVTRTRARMVWIWKRRRGVARHGRKLRGRRRPTGTPRRIMPMLVPLERRGFVITSISLSVRLFANMMAGHILLKVIGGFGWTRRVGRDRTGRRPRGVLRRLFGLETAVACVQAYVFTLLTCIYRTDIVKGGH